MNPSEPAPRFLSVDDVLILHAIAIEDQGGNPSLRDRALLESAITMPAQQFGEQYLHEDIPTMAAAYAFHICMNHPFVDGNKRAAVAAMIAFLSDNGWRFDATADEAELVILKLAAGNLDKPAFTDWTRKHMHKKPKMELRDFFAQLTWEKVSQMAESVVAGASATEADATTNEAAQAIPLIAQFRSAAQAAQRNEQNQNADQVAQHNEQNQTYAYFNAMAIFLTAIHRIAEDMGYEW